MHSPRVEAGRLCLFSPRMQAPWNASLRPAAVSGDLPKATDALEGTVPPAKVRQRYQDGRKSWLAAAERAGKADALRPISERERRITAMEISAKRPAQTPAAINPVTTQPRATGPQLNQGRDEARKAVAVRQAELARLRGKPAPLPAAGSDAAARPLPVAAGSPTAISSRENPGGRAKPGTPAPEGQPDRQPVVAQSGQRSGVAPATGNVAGNPKPSPPTEKPGQPGPPVTPAPETPAPSSPPVPDKRGAAQTSERAAELADRREMAQRAKEELIERQRALSIPRVAADPAPAGNAPLPPEPIPPVSKEAAITASPTLPGHNEQATGTREDQVQVQQARQQTRAIVQKTAAQPIVDASRNSARQEQAEQQ